MIHVESVFSLKGKLHKSTFSFFACHREFRTNSGGNDVTRALARIREQESRYRI